MAEQDTGATQEGDGPFVFVGDALALDLVNTEVVVRGKPRDLLATPRDVAAWWCAARRHHPRDMPPDVGATADDAACHQAITQLRAALRGLFSALADGARPAQEHLMTLNAVLAAGYPALVVSPDDTMRLAYRSRDEAMAPLLPIALSAARLATGDARERLHRCANEHCLLLFYDTTRSATRRWCSVSCKDRDRKMTRYHQALASAQ